MSLINIDAKIVNTMQTEFNNTLKRSYIMINLVSFHGCQDSSRYIKSINMIQHINRIKD
jgi:hypothetical protein